jgi:valyl-tRNA synthetase
MRMEEIARPAIQVARDGRVRFFPARFGELYLRWMENLRDWCIGRQLWWGHRIPIWTCANGHVDAYREDPTRCDHCESGVLSQETDVLDTWFSSALWPLSTLGWPDDTPDLAYFYPTRVLSTDRGILYLWVARMIYMGLEFKNDVPFHDVYIHATVLTKDGRRMSKSLGTGIDPLNLFDQYGTDATRFGLAWMTGQGQDIRFSEERIQMSRNFANKIWNAVRLSLRFLGDAPGALPGGREKWSVYDRWIVSRLVQVTSTVTRAIDEYAFDAVAKALYDFFWDEVCDWYLELIKPVFYDRDDAEERQRTAAILDHVIGSFLRLLHPVMPFITEECWHALPGDRGSIVVAPWPTVDESLIDNEAQTLMALVIDVIRGIRNMRADLGAAPRDETEAILVFPDQENRAILQENADAMRRLANATPVRIEASLDPKPPAAFSTRCGGGEVFLPMPSAFVGKEIERLSKELQNLQGTIEGARRKLDNPAFVEKAKPEVVERERARLAELEGNREKVGERLALMRSVG